MLGISSRADAIRQRPWRRFFCTNMLPIRDLCATAFCVLLFFVFYGEKLMQHFVTDAAMFTQRD